MKARYAAGGNKVRSDWTMKIGREFGFIAIGMRIKKPTDIKVEAIGRQSPHHALFMNRRVNKQRLATKYNPPATPAATLLGEYLYTAETIVGCSTLIVLLSLVALAAPMRKATMTRMFTDCMLLMTGGFGAKDDIKMQDSQGLYIQLSPVKDGVFKQYVVISAALGLSL